MKQLFHAVLYDQAIYETSSVTKLLKSSKTVSQSFNGLFTLSPAAHWYPTFFQFDSNHDIADDDIGPTIKHSSIPDELLKCIQTALDSEKNLEPSSLSHLTIGGRTYSTSTKHLGNSHILLKSGIPGQMIPARIDYITQVMVPSNSAVIYIAARNICLSD